ncbi:MAG: tail fiber domain-containing protein [Polaromonas sp.]|nr:tail fiber domain-containing protein [Polaromonas sp.]
MPSSYSSNLKIELMATGENSGTWGTITNTNLGTAMEQAVIGLGNPDFIADANLTITLSNTNASQAARALVLNVTSVFGSLTATRELVVPTIEKQYIVQNNTAGGQSITVKTSAGTGITVPNGRKAHLYVDGVNVVQMFDFVDINGGTIDGATVGAASASTGAFTSLTVSGATTLNGAVALGDAAGDLITVPGTVNSNLLFTDNTFDIGASGATRPRDLFLSRNLVVGGTLTLTGGVNLNGNVTVGDSSADTLTINSTITSNLLFTDNTYDIGASGATRPRNLFLAGNITAAGTQTLTGALTVDSTTDSTSTTTGSIQTDGGVGIAKALFVGTTANVTGVSTLTAGALIQGLTVGLGAGAVATNTAVGVSALAANGAGANNTAVGYVAGAFTSGSNNTAVGYGAYVATTGSTNTGIGQQALFSNTSGGLNTAVGGSALQSNVSGVENTAVGASALVNSTGSYNSALGRFALASNTTASNNTAVGYQAGYSNTTGSGILAIGFQAGYSNTSGNGNTAIGNGNAFTGAALYSNVSGGNNVAVGSGSLFTTTASNNTALGYESAKLTSSGTFNVAVGTQALYSNTTASNNTAVGYQAGYTNTTGTGLVAIGESALNRNTTGYNNIGIGQEAVYANTTGISNTGVGHTSLRFNTTGSSNVAMGQEALYSNTTASNQTALGYQAGYLSTAGNNVFLGTRAGDTLTTGYQNVYIGSLSQASGVNAQSEIVIGFNVAGKGTDTGFIAPSNGGVYQGNNSTLWSVISDQRLKKNIVDNNTGLSIINQIQVRNFEYRLPEEITELPQDQAIQKQGVQLGVIAQELQQVLPECVKTESTGVMSVDADNLTWYMINAIKELKAEFDAYKATHP